MLSTLEFEAWCLQLNLNNNTRQIISQIRSSQPSRSVQGARSNVCGTYPSQKMGVTIQFESHRGELAHIIDFLEHGKEVLEYYDQPPPIELIYESKNGNLVRCRHTPDFFVITTNGAFWEEFKTKEELTKQFQQRPGRYIQSDLLHWRCPPGENFAQRYGLGYHVCSDVDINPIRLRNWIWLEPYFQTKNLLVNEQNKSVITEIIKANPAITIAELLKLNSSIKPDDINYLIAISEIYVNLDIAPLSEPDKVKLFDSQEILTAYQNDISLSSSTNKIRGIRVLNVDIGTSVVWDDENWLITNLGSHKVYLTSLDGKVVSIANNEFYRLFETGNIVGIEQQTELNINTTVQEILSRARPKDIQTANERYEAIQSYLENNELITKTGRTLRRWRDNYLQAEKIYGKGNGYVGLLPRHLDKGHHEKLKPELFAFMDKFIEENYFTPKNRRISAVYRDFKQACQNHEPSFDVPSEKYFRLQIKRKSNHYKLNRARIGSRGAKQTKPFYTTPGLPRHGELPWESAHIDHTLVDIELVSSLLSLATCNTSSALTQSNINLGRCWASLMVDSYRRCYVESTL